MVIRTTRRDIGPCCTVLAEKSRPGGGNGCQGEIGRGERKFKLCCRRDAEGAGRDKITKRKLIGVVIATR